MLEKLKKLFASNTENHELHHTTDGVCFWDKSHAVAHSKNLSDPTVTTVSRATVEKDETDAEALERISKRKDQIMSALDPYKLEWETLCEQEKVLLAKIAEPGTDKTDPVIDPPITTEPTTTDPAATTQAPAPDATATTSDPETTEPASTEDSAAADSGSTTATGKTKNTKK